MNETQTIAIRTEFDVFIARQQARELARAAGFDTKNQARIALATSSLAHALRLGNVYQGQVNIDRLGGGKSTGVRVICTALDGANGNLSSQAFTDTRWLVDELTVEKMSSNDLQATVVKWANQTQGRIRE
jgi:hypothetical protein